MLGPTTRAVENRGSSTVNDAASRSTCPARSCRVTSQPARTGSQETGYRSLSMPSTGCGSSSSWATVTAAPSGNRRPGAGGTGGWFPGGWFSGGWFSGGWFSGGPGTLPTLLRGPSRARHGPRACARGPPDCDGYWSAGDLTCWYPGGMVTSVWARLAELGGSHCMSVTLEVTVRPPEPPYAADEPNTRTGR